MMKQTKEQSSDLKEHGKLYKVIQNNSIIYVPESAEENKVHDVYDAYGLVYLHRELTPLTPQEVWALMPWDYDMGNAPIIMTTFLAKSDKGFTYAVYHDGFGRHINGYDGDNINLIAWLPLPEIE